MSEASSRPGRAGALARARDLLLRQHTETGRLSVAVGLGVFIGLTPFYGLHTLLALALAGLLRLNIAATVLGTHVSNPLFAVGLIPASAWLGSLMGAPPPPAGFEWWNPMHARFYESWLKGGLALGVLLGALCGGLTYLVASLIRKRRHA